VLAMVQAGLPDVAGRIARHGLSEAAALRGGDVRLLPPLPNPGRVFGIASNYRCGLAELGRTPPDAPVLFMKRPETLIGPGTPVVLPADVGGCTYEAELAAVIGSSADNVAPEIALSHVAAYGVFNDVSASEMIRREGSFDRGKNLPGFGPFGPFLATADEVGDPQALRLGLRCNGVVMQESTTAQMLFDVANLIAILSRDTPLQPGDVIATGTPAGIAPARKPPTWIKPGDVLSAWVEGLGTLTNPVVAGGPLHG
ncbi:MAG: fumarylacetoacetate hydrolase family protein, partial [Pseudolabrys sp.]|nr:fumarylacetoacetate hydrolase family protein [Pseudolabrys sp.]